MVPLNRRVPETYLLPEMPQLLHGKGPQYRQRSIVSRESVRAPSRRGEGSCAPVVEAASLEVAHQDQRPGYSDHLAEQGERILVCKVVERQDGEAHVERVVGEGEPEGVAHEDAE